MFSKVESYSAFYTANQGRVLGYLLQMTGDYQLARDLTQETFTRYRRIQLDPEYGETHMIRKLTIGIALVWLAGCATHYYKEQDGSLVFYLDKPDARQVIFASSLDDFTPHEACRVDGRWVVSLPGASTFRYYYILDGEVYTPSCKLKENDDFGSQNCIFDPQL